MPEFSFSEEFKAKVREHIAPLSVKVLREVVESPEILVESLSCAKCGYSFDFNPPKVTKATAVHDCEWKHRFSWETGQQCGGQVMFVTSPKEALRNEEATSSLLRFVPAGLGAR